MKNTIFHLLIAVNIRKTMFYHIPRIESHQYVKKLHISRFDGCQYAKKHHISCIDDRQSRRQYVKNTILSRLSAENLVQSTKGQLGNRTHRLAICTKSSIGFFYL